MKYSSFFLDQETFDKKSLPFEKKTCCVWGQVTCRKLILMSNKNLFTAKDLYSYSIIEELWALKNGKYFKLVCLAVNWNQKIIWSLVTCSRDLFEQMLNSIFYQIYFIPNEVKLPLMVCVRDMYGNCCKIFYIKVIIKCENVLLPFRSLIKSPERSKIHEWMQCKYNCKILFQFVTS